MSGTLRDVVLAARTRLVTAGLDANEAAMDAALLARHLLGWELSRLIAHETDQPPAGFAAAFEPLVARRERREPSSAIVGHREFWGLEFEVGPAVLTPRPETELIVEEAMACLAGAELAPAVLVDVGTGSGCLAVCLAREFPASRVIATDVSAPALAVAAHNAARHGVGDRVEFRQASLLEGVAGPATMIVSNPPYIPTREISGLAPEVRDWEPRTALDGGTDGLDLVRALIWSAPRILVPGGWLIMEFGFGQARPIEAIVGRSRLEMVRVARDLQQINPKQVQSVR